MSETKSLKGLLRCFLIILMALIARGISAAPVLQWDPSPGADGHRVYCGETPLASPVPVDVPSGNTHDLVGTVVNGTEYECWVTAYAEGFFGRPKLESPHSNHLVFIPQEHQTVILPAAPTGLTITW